MYGIPFILHKNQNLIQNTKHGSKLKLSYGNEMTLLVSYGEAFPWVSLDFQCDALQKYF